jgi:uncharacterized damage-inducible protein DinB
MTDESTTRAGDARTPLPADPGFAAEERVMLPGFLDYYRAVFVRKAEGLSDDQARRAPCPPSDLSVMGIVRHMADVERSWFRRCLAAEDAGPIYYGAAHPDGDRDGDFHPGPADTLDEAIAAWRREVDAARANVAGRSLDDVADAPPREDEVPSLRWITIHMVEEYARHCGHLDLIREAIDGVTGD